MPVARTSGHVGSHVGHHAGTLFAHTSDNPSGVASDVAVYATSATANNPTTTARANERRAAVSEIVNGAAKTAPVRQGRFRINSRTGKSLVEDGLERVRVRPAGAAGWRGDAKAG
jgi:hypothetical protein